MKTESLNILLVDDHDMVRAGFRRLLSDQPRFVIAAEARSVAEALACLDAGRFDVILLDLFLPDGSGVEVLKNVATRQPAIPVLVLSGFSEEQYGVNMLRAGAAGFLSKTCPAEQLIEAIETVSAGRRYASAQLAGLMGRGSRETPPVLKHQQLSQREFQIFCGLAAGKTVTEIGENLYISVKTVSTYRSRLLEKMGLKTNSELTYYAVKNGLLQ
ncbi:MAG: response regulator transcription factor [Betaproteobacteria bacterium]|nr:response regulator transcription factor [Betaproteobacteria bacterium]